MNSINLVAGTVPTIVQRQFPFRFGVVPLVDTEDGARMARLFYYLIETYGDAPTTQFLRRVRYFSSDISVVTDVM